MSNPALDVGGMIRFGWDKTKANLGILVGLVLAFVVVGLIVQTIAGKISPVLGILVGWLVNAWLIGGVYKAIIKAHDGQKPEISDLFSGTDVFGPVLVANIGLMFSMVIGFMLLFVPGLYAIARLGFAPFLAVDRRLSGIDALKESARLTKGRAWQAFTLHFAAGCVLFLGALCLGVGVLVALPVYTIAMVHAIRWMDTHPVGAVAAQAV